jgi:fructokinase
MISNSEQRKTEVQSLFDVVALGELLIDMIPVKRPADRKLVYEVNPGGAPSNVLAEVSKLGGATAFIGKVGDDFFGHFLEAALTDCGIDTHGLSYTREAKTALAFVHLDEKGDRSFSFYRDPGADTKLGKGDVNLEIIEQAKIFHFGSLSMTDEPAESATIKAVKYAKRKGKKISFDPNWRPALWNHKAAKAKMVNGLRYTDILKISEVELKLLTGEIDLNKGSKQLYDAGIKLVLTTLGPNGCHYRYARGSGKLNTYDTKVVDTTGAGDAFMGGLLYRLSKLEKPIEEVDKDELEEIIDFSNAAGALCASKVGAIAAMPSLWDINICRKTIPKLIASSIV